MVTFTIELLISIENQYFRMKKLDAERIKI